MKKCQHSLQGSIPDANGDDSKQILHQIITLFQDMEIEISEKNRISMLAIF